VPPPIPSSYDIRLVLCRLTLSDVQINTNSGAQILSARSPGRNFVQWCLIFMGIRYRSYLHSHVWCRRILRWIRYFLRLCGKLNRNVYDFIIKRVVMNKMQITCGEGTWIWILCLCVRASWINVNNCPTRCNYIQFVIQGEHKVFPWLQTFITRKLRGIRQFLFSKCYSIQDFLFTTHQYTSTYASFVPVVVFL
jgi:hypothetical protein